jgi:hypothetical protein
MEKNRALHDSHHRAYVLGQQRFLNTQSEGEAGPYPWDCAERSEFWRGFYDERKDLRAVMGAKA